MNELGGVGVGLVVRGRAEGEKRRGVENGGCNLNKDEKRDAGRMSFSSHVPQSTGRVIGLVWLNWGNHWGGGKGPNSQRGEKGGGT